MDPRVFDSTPALLFVRSLYGASPEVHADYNKEGGLAEPTRLLFQPHPERQGSMKNYYQILEVEQDASAEKIKEQYLFLAQAWHPDKFSKADQKARAEEKIKQVNAAYDVLRNPAKREEYDQKLQAPKKTTRKQAPTQQAAPPRPTTAPAKVIKRPARSKGLFGSLGVFGSNRHESDELVRVFLNGRAYFLGVDELAHARVQYFLNGESKGMLEFKSSQHVMAAVNQVAVPNGYEIHVLRLAPYQGRPEQVFMPKVSTAPRR
jgi:DnaJ-domain-containing protein 1